MTFKGWARFRRGRFYRSYDGMVFVFLTKKCGLRFDKSAGTTFRRVTVTVDEPKKRKAKLAIEANNERVKAVIRNTERLLAKKPLPRCVFGKGKR